MRSIPKAMMIGCMVVLVLAGSYMLIKGTVSGAWKSGSRQSGAPIDGLGAFDRRTDVNSDHYGEPGSKEGWEII